MGSCEGAGGPHGGSRMIQAENIGKFSSGQAICSEPRSSPDAYSRCNSTVACLTGYWALLIQSATTTC